MSWLGRQALLLAKARWVEQSGGGAISRGAGRWSFIRFWQTTCDWPFKGLVADSDACYRLTVRASQTAGHRVIQMQRPLTATADRELVAHFFQFGLDNAASAATYRFLPGNWSFGRVGRAS